ncbi:PREDICTED: uncharacterized protein LOC104763398 [Camelina sativa]|uniref:Uncharacterized protein LOC104763398 n=1 Tax=Camelina sativa TaxID=90675 RepID=A0ABM0XF79_CAMSA|nr:PREDICTED: uncharacterized protein LOC104763398 [Camelina sativa]
MKIVVETLEGTRFEIEVELKDSVAKVKKNIEDVVGDSTYPAAQQILTHKGKVLRDETTMEANKVIEKSVIAIMMTKYQSLQPLVQSSALEVDEGKDPYNDLFGGFEQCTEEDFSNVMADPNPNLMDMSFLENSPPPLDFSTLSIDVDETKLLYKFDLSIADYDINNDELSFVDDGFTISWDMFEPSNDDDLNENINNDVLGEIGNDNGNNNVGEITTFGVSTRVFGDPNGPDFESGGTSTMDVLVPTSSDEMLVCSCCKMLRELVHIKDGEMSTLEIFGGIGFFCHAILLTQWFASDSTERQSQTFHLKDLTMEEVKRFIEDYCSERVASGLSLVQDTNATFYQAISANFIFNQLPPMLTIPSPTDVPMFLVSPDEALDVPLVPLHVGPREETTTGVPKERKKRKTPLATQRERTKRLTLKDINMLFHLPIETAAKQMNLCPTVLKKICRKGSLMRWPHRKIKSLHTKITSLKSLVHTAKNDKVKARTEAEIERLQRRIDKICSDALKNMK